MFPLLTLIPSIIGAASKVSEIFSSAKKAKQEITGTPSVASTPEELQDEIAALPEDQQAKWAQIMEQKVDLYKAENERLDIEIGRVDSNITSKLTPKAASKIAVMRQTTRPWAVRMMVHYVFFPFYLIIIDVVQGLLYSWVFKWVIDGDKSPVFKTFDYVFGTFSAKDLSTLGKVISTITDPMAQTMMAKIYGQTVPYAAGIIVSYMGLREISKAKGTSGDVGSTIKQGGASVGEILSGTISKGLGLVNRVKSIFGK